jgi:hypothetical protein
MRNVATLVAVVVVALAGTVAVTAFGRDASRSAKPARVTIVSDLWFELVGQFQNSATGVTPVTHIHYGYLSWVKGVSGFADAPQDEATAKFTFFADGTTLPGISNGPLRSGTRLGKLTIYLDPSANSDFANPDTFRDGTPVLIVQYRHQPIGSTLTGAITLFSEDTITFTRPFDSGHGSIQLGKVGEGFTEHYIGQNNMPGPPSGYFIGYATSRCCEGDHPAAAALASALLLGHGHAAALEQGPVASADMEVKVELEAGRLAQ